MSLGTKQALPAQRRAHDHGPLSDQLSAHWVIGSLGVITLPTQRSGQALDAKRPRDATPKTTAIVWWKRVLHPLMDQCCGAGDSAAPPTWRRHISSVTLNGMTLKNKKSLL